MSKRSLRNVVIRPLSYVIKPTLEDDNTLILTLEKPRKLSIEPDGRKAPLLLFANHTETDVPKPGDEGIVYFGPGMHKPEKIILGSDQT
ncbi:MAG: glycosyl hydrolase family 28 protein, partial [Planctomycetota bacterium]